MLSAEQIQFFKNEGYLIVPGAMDLALCQQVRELMWQALPPETVLQLEEIASFTGPFHAKDESADERVHLGEHERREGERREEAPGDETDESHHQPHAQE